MPGAALAIAAAAGVLLAAEPARTAGDADLLPAEGFVAGWRRLEAPRVFEGRALYDHIDGGGESFLEQGFEAVTVGRYRRGEAGLTVEIYRMTDPDAALGIYLTKCGREVPDPDLAERHTAGRWQLALAKNRYYILIHNETGDPAVASVLVEAGRRIASRIEPAGASALARLPAEGLVPGSARILRGALGLQAFVTLAEGNVLGLSRAVTAVAGDYPHPAGGTFTRIIADYPTAESAGGAFRRLREGLDPLLEVVESADGWLVYRDPAGKLGSAAVEGVRIEIRLGLPVRPESPHH